MSTSSDARQLQANLVREARDVAQRANQLTIELILMLNAVVYSLERGIRPDEAQEEDR